MSNIGLNKAILLGNAGQDAGKKLLSGGKSVADFSLAIDQPFRNQRDGHQRGEWVRCGFWARRRRPTTAAMAKRAAPSTRTTKRFRSELEFRLSTFYSEASISSMASPSRSFSSSNHAWGSRP
jgi:Single-strand binding protein family